MAVSGFCVKDRKIYRDCKRKIKQEKRKEESDVKEKMLLGRKTAKSYWYWIKFF